ncbi:lysine transporter [Halarcobacter ebronensis]|uniref:Lysine transporter n=1 Tax=Halarcobacter ebronensis TaxID=1462615 RepID=A0A4Q1AS31_9BACT|nr:LysE family translocator [Halarcobacter ebronensis]QKF80643.1 transporter, LysE family [Halarcobacter ebronensis]RXJ68584.1 lysine transporter [Halarcobacter ebronensis]RXK08444.1 lysine transporter [Halarcobacter ebronensis]
MSFLTILAFAGAMFLLAVTPGPGVFATVSRALASGFTNAAILVVGIILGDIVYLLMAIFGLKSIAMYMGEFFIFVKYIGGVYLIYLGYKILTSKQSSTNIKAKSELSWKKNFLTGLLITLSNPKVILFYLGFLPTFVNLNSLKVFDILIIVSITIFVIACVLLSYAYSASGAKKLFKSKSAQKKMDIAAGSVMITAGGVLILKA